MVKGIPRRIVTDLFQIHNKPFADFISFKNSGVKLCADIRKTTSINSSTSGILFYNLLYSKVLSQLYFICK